MRKIIVIVILLLFSPIILTQVYVSVHLWLLAHNLVSMMNIRVFIIYSCCTRVWSWCWAQRPCLRLASCLKMFVFFHDWPRTKCLCTKIVVLYCYLHLLLISLAEIAKSNTCWGVAVQVILALSCICGLACLLYLAHKTY